MTDVGCERYVNRCDDKNAMQSKFEGQTLDGAPCDPFNPPGGGLCFNLPLPTPWSADVDPENPLPEYPRPQLQRERWRSLNGIWEFEPYG